MAQINTTTSILLDGITDRMELSTTPPSSLLTPIASISGKVWGSIWFKTTLSAFAYLFSIFKSGAGSTTFRMGMSGSGKMNLFHRRLGGVAFESVNSFNDGNWHNAVVLSEGNVLYVGIDGVEDANTGTVNGTGGGGPVYTIGSQLATFLFPGNLTQHWMGVGHTDSRASVFTKLYNGGNPPDVGALSGLGTLEVRYPLPGQIPPVATLDLGKDNGTTIPDMDLITGLTISDAVLDYPSPPISGGGGVSTPSMGLGNRFAGLRVNKGAF